MMPYLKNGNARDYLEGRVDCNRFALVGELGYLYLNLTDHRAVATVTSSISWTSLPSPQQHRTC